MIATLGHDELEFITVLRQAGEAIGRRDSGARHRWIAATAQIGLFDLSDDLAAIPSGTVWQSGLLLSAVRVLASAGVTAAIPDIVVARRELVRTGQGHLLEGLDVVGLSLGSDGRELARNADIVSAVAVPDGDDVRLLAVGDSGERAGFVADLGWCVVEGQRSATLSVSRRLSPAAERDWRALTTAMLLGLCDRALDLAAGYVKQRRQFDRPLASNQAVSHRFADMYTSRRALDLLLENLPTSDADAVDPAFAYAGREAIDIARGCQHVFGGYGASDEYEIGHLVREAMAAAALGQAERIRVTLGKQLLASGWDDSTLTAGEDQAGLRREIGQLLDRIFPGEVRDECTRTGATHHPGFFRGLAAAGWVGGDWPGHYGGSGRTAQDLVVMFEEASLRGAPISGYSVTMIAARTLLRCGTEEQRTRLLPQIAAGEISMAIGFTEPEAGSDVANCRTRARRDGDHWVIDGQKNFTGCAQFADFVLVLARTGDGPKHKRLTLFLVPTAQPGFDVAPVWLHGGSRTNITYYNNVVVPDELRIGDVDAGWQILTTALAYERGLDGPLTWQLDRLCRDLASWAAPEGVADETTMPGLSSLAGDLAIAARVSRAFTNAVASEAGTTAPSGIDGAMAKLYQSETISVLTSRLLTVLGRQSLLDPSVKALIRAYYDSIPTTIYSGCSEVQRDIIAQRGHGFPRPATS